MDMDRSPSYREPMTTVIPVRTDTDAANDDSKGRPRPVGEEGEKGNAGKTTGQN
jgi:hypothetical protein